MGAEEWQYADTLEAVTARLVPLYLSSSGNSVIGYGVERRNGARQIDRSANHEIPICRGMACGCL